MRCCGLLARNLPYSAPRPLQCDLISVFLFSNITPQSNYRILCFLLSLSPPDMISVYCLLPTIMKVMTVHLLCLPLFHLSQNNQLFWCVWISVTLLHRGCWRVCLHARCMPTTPAVMAVNLQKPTGDRISHNCITVEADSCCVLWIVCYSVRVWLVHHNLWQAISPFVWDLKKGSWKLCK